MTNAGSICACYRKAYLFRVRASQFYRDSGSYPANGITSCRSGVLAGLLRQARRVWPWLLMLLVPATAHAIDASEDQIKAAYLYQFTQFIQWPATAFATPDAEFHLCVTNANTDSLARALAPLAARHQQDHIIVIKHLDDMEAIQDCHLLYISSTQHSREAAMLESLSGSPVLTVSSLHDFAAEGGTIEFVHVGNHLRFIINRTACSRAGLSCSAKLLEVATRVIDDNAVRGGP